MAPQNTLEAFEAALAGGVDMIEFDVYRHRGRMILAHAWWDAIARECCPLDVALARLAQPRFAHLELNVDLKGQGHEERAVAALRRHGLLGRSLVSSQHPRSLDRVRAADPDVRLGISIGGRGARRLRRWRERTWRWEVLEALASGRFQALMAHHRVLDRDFVAQVRAAGAELYAWTVDDLRSLRRLLQLQVDGVTTNDPLLFAQI
jgi:glycerophosphoryl diester phosphodiesterase